MKPIIYLIVLLFSTGLLAQNPDGLGIDNSPILNETEVILLNKLLEEQRGIFDFNHKKVAFLTGSSGSRILPKSAFFHKSVIPWLEQGSKPQIIMVQLTSEEKLNSGGYDVLVLSWVKFLSDRRQKRIVRSLQKIKQ